MIQALLHGSLRLWKVRCLIKKGIDKEEKLSLQRSQLVHLYYDILQTKPTWPSYFHDALPHELSNLDNIQLDIIQNWIRTFQACELAIKVMKDVPTPPQDEWIRINSQQKKGRQMHINTDGSLCHLHL